MTTSTKHCWAKGCLLRAVRCVHHGSGAERVAIPLCNRHLGLWPVPLKPAGERHIGLTTRPKRLPRKHLKTEGLAPMTTAPTTTAAPTAFIITGPPQPGELDETSDACRVAGCDGAIRSRGLCGRHYRQAIKRGLIEEWGAAPKGHGGWRNHKAGVRIEAPPTPGQVDHSAEGCVVVGCTNAPRRRGLCSLHHSQASRAGLINAWGRPAMGPGGRAPETPAASSAEEVGSEADTCDVPSWPPTAETLVEWLRWARVDVTVEEVNGWSEEQRDQATKWAAAMAELAALEPDVQVPPKPDFLPAETERRPAFRYFPEDQLDADKLREELDAEEAELKEQATQLEVKAAGIVTRKRALRTAQCLRELIKVDDFEVMPLWMQDIFDHNLAVARQRIEEELLQAAAYGPRPTRGGAA